MKFIDQHGNELHMEPIDPAVNWIRFVLIVLVEIEMLKTVLEFGRYLERRREEGDG